MTDAEPPLISSSDLAKKLGLARRTVSYYAKSGSITPALITPGGQYRWRYQDVLTEMHELARKRQQDQQ